MLPLSPDAFACGVVRFLSKHPITDDPRILVPVRIGPGEPESIFAIVDTGSPWFILAPDKSDDLNIDRSVCEYRDRRTEPLLTPYGKFGGWLCREQVAFVADEGTGIDFETTLFIPHLEYGENWPRDLHFAGLENFLFRIRFAVDPARDNQLFYFGGPVY